MSSPLSPSLASSESTPRFRAGAVAHMVRMPVATLRIWEQRYRLTPKAVPGAGRRLYSTADVQRIGLLKQLSDLGHAIGTIAALDMEQLRQVAVTHVKTITGSARPMAPVRERTPWRVVVVGVALAHRLQHPSLLRRLGRAPEVSGPFVSLAEAVHAQAGQPVDTLLVHTHGLHDASLAELQAAAGALEARQVAVFYGFAKESVCRAFESAGVALLREPKTDAALDEWLCQLHGDDDRPPGQTATPAALLGLVSVSGVDGDEIPLRRYDDATLADFAARLSSVACECPRHVVDLLMQLSHFETYSAECEQLSPADIALHAYLRRTAAAARHLFEVALERLAKHEGATLAT